MYFSTLSTAVEVCFRVTDIDDHQLSKFTFFPIEPPRPPPTKEETFARLQHLFVADSSQAAKKKNTLFVGLRPASPVPSSAETLRVGVDARLPHPPIITCNEPLPLRILVQKLSASSNVAYLQMLQIELVAYTYIRAHELRRIESGSWVIASISNLGTRLGQPDDPVGTEVLVDEGHWKTRALPNTVAPSFETCNISRRYELEIKVSLTSGPSSASKVGSSLFFSLALPSFL